MEKKNNLDKIMLIVFIITLLTGLLTLYIVLNKGSVFGKRLVSTSEDIVEKEVIHSIQITTDKKYLSTDSEDTANLIVTIDGVDIQDGFELEVSDENLVSIENNVVTSLGKTGEVVIKAKSTDYEIEDEITIEIVESDEN